MNESLKKGNDFLNYIAKNQEKLKKEFYKGVNYNPDTYDDLWQDTIIKVYDSIILNNKDIHDYKRYFFIALKYSCLYEATKSKRNVNIDDHKELYDLIDNEYDDVTEIKYNALKKIVTDKFGEENSNIFFDFMKRKYSDEKTSYSSYSKVTGLSCGQIYQIVSSIKKYLKANQNFKYNGLDI